MRDSLGSKRMRRILSLVCGSALIVSCLRDRGATARVDTALVYVQAPAVSRGPLRLHLTITKELRVLVDGQAVTDAGLDSALTVAQAAHGGVWLYRAMVDSSTRSRADSVRESVTTRILNHDLAIWIAYRPDFSDLQRKMHPQ
jgi:hypothetical protein